MIRRQFILQGLALLVALAACTIRQQLTTAEACRAIPGDAVVAGAALQDCLDSMAAGATLALPPRRFVLTRPLVLRQRVTLTTAQPRGACQDDPAHCATLVLRLTGAVGTSQRAITVGNGFGIKAKLFQRGMFCQDAAGIDLA